MDNFAFTYDSASAHSEKNMRVAHFSDYPHQRHDLRDAAEASHFEIIVSADLDALPLHAVSLKGAVILVDCSSIRDEQLETVKRSLDACRNNQCAVVISTTPEGLEAIYAIANRDVQILINASRAERLLALAYAYSSLPGALLQELAEEDRLLIFRLTQQITQIAERLDRLAPSTHGTGDALPAVAAKGSSAFQFENKSDGAHEAYVEVGLSPPDPQVVRKVIANRHLRARHFDGDLFADPAWDILLDLTAARIEHVRVSVTSLCIASGVPATTALRWIVQMTEAGLLQRHEDETDRRRAFITLTDRAMDAMTRYFAAISKGTAVLS